VWIRGVGFRDPRPGDLIGSLQCAPAVPSDDYRAIHRRSIGESSRCANPHHTDEEGRKNDHGNYPDHRLRRLICFGSKQLLDPFLQGSRGSPDRSGQPSYLKLKP
jgi:hypothetical protein